MRIIEIDPNNRLDTLLHITNKGEEVIAIEVRPERVWAVIKKR